MIPTAEVACAVAHALGEASFRATVDAEGGRACLALLEEATRSSTAPATIADTTGAVLAAARAAGGMAWQRLHCGPFRDVPAVWRRLYAAAGVLPLAAASAAGHGEVVDLLCALKVPRGRGLRVQF